MPAHALKNLVKRGEIYYFRLAIPTGLQSRFGCKEMKSSLRTDNRRVARLRCRILSNQFEELFSYIPIMSDLTPDQLQNIARGYFRDLLVQGNDTIFRIENDLFNHTDERANEQQEWLDGSIDREARLRELNQAGKAANIFVGTADTLLERHGANPKAAGEGRDILSQYIVRAQIEQERIFQAKIRKHYQEIAPLDPLFTGIMDDTLPPLPEFGLGTPQTTTALATTIEKFTTARQGTWAHKTGLDFARVLKWFQDFMGADRVLSSITTQDIGKFRDLLLKIPKNYNKGKGNAGLTLTEAMELMSEHDTITPQTAEKYLNMARAFMNWCETEGFIEKVPGKKISVDYKVTEKARLPFTQDELKALFSSPIWRGCYSHARRSRPGTMIFKNAYYWIPLIAVYTGMRCGEIVQLRHMDIHTAEGVSYFDVNDDNQKKLKTKYSRRRIPIHPRLLEWGLADFLAKRNKGKPEERVFKEISISTQGDPSNAFSKAFARYLKDIGLKNKKLTFHSFRHTVPDALDNASVPEAHKHAMMGHADKSSSAQYGIGASIPVLFESMSKISYAFEADFEPSPASCDIISKG